MRLRPLSAALSIAGACSGFAGTAQAQAQAAPKVNAVATPASAPDAATERRTVHEWLARVHSAAKHSNFSGTFVVSAGGSVSSSRIAHFCDGRNEFEQIDTMDGQPRRVFRHNDMVKTVWPQSRLAVVESRDWMSSFPALVPGGDERIADYYEVHAMGADRVAGHEANVLLLEPKDRLRYGHRLWTDKASGLLLRSEILGPQDEVLESSAFSDVTIGVRTQPGVVQASTGHLDGYRVLQLAFTRTQLEAEGWTLQPVVNGFQPMSVVKRPLDGRPAAAGAAPAHEVLQSVFSDGMTYVSVFIEPFDAERHPRPLQTSVGATQTLMRRQGDSWVTVVGDVPPATLRLFADALERKR